MGVKLASVQSELTEFENLSNLAEVLAFVVVLY